MQGGMATVTAAALLCVGALLAASCGSEAPAPDADAPAGQSDMKITSSEFGEGDTIPALYTCDGPGVSPPLAFSGVPAEAVALCLIVDDPDAPRGTFAHWLVWDMPPDTAGIGEGEAAPGGVGQNGFGDAVYGGPCPPRGERHTYRFQLYALDAKLNLPLGSKLDAVREAAEAHSIARAVFSAQYAREE